MAEATTIRVRTSTRDELKALSAERHTSVDDLIREGIGLIRMEAWRRQAEADARRAAADAVDRAEVASLLRDLAPRRTFGTMRFDTPDDFDSPLPERELQAWE